MTDAQMLQNLLAVYEAIIVSDFLGSAVFSSCMPLLKEVIAELRRRIELEETK